MKPRVITQRELRNQSAAVMDAVEAGETLRITRNGVEIAEVSPVSASAFVPMKAVLEAMKNVPSVNLAELRAEVDALFGSDRLIDD